MNLIDSFIASVSGTAKPTAVQPAEPIERLPKPVSSHQEEVITPPPTTVDRVETSPTIKPTPTYAYEPFPKQLSLEQLEEILRRMNLSFDLFEIQRIFIVDPAGKEEPRIEVRNTVTGELIRTIPMNEIVDLYQEFKQSVGSLINKFL